jgi:hypothetical protein
MMHPNVFPNRGFWAIAGRTNESTSLPWAVHGLSGQADISEDRGSFFRILYWL